MEKEEYEVMFSIVTVCYDAGKELEKTILSILQQTYEHFEIIIKDGLSTDGSLDFIENDERIRLIKMKDSGIYDAMNQALESCNGDYIIFMNAGDLFYNNDVLALLNASIIETDYFSCYYGKCYNRKLHRISPYPSHLSRFTCYRSMICHQSMVYSNKLFAKKRYNTMYRILADRDFLLWLCMENKIQPHFLDITIVDYQAGGVSDSEKNQRIIQEERKIINKQYFSACELITYRIIHMLTLPMLRKKIAKSKKYARIYSEIIKRAYKLIGK